MNLLQGSHCGELGITSETSRSGLDKTHDVCSPATYLAPRALEKPGLSDRGV